MPAVSTHRIKNHQKQHKAGQLNHQLKCLSENPNLKNTPDRHRLLPAENNHKLSIRPPVEDFDYEQITNATRRSAETFSRTTLKVIQLLLVGDLGRLRSDTIADELRISPTTLRRRLRADSVCYQELLDCVRQYRCEKQLGQGWLPGKTLAWDLGYAEVNSFYRAFKRWTGLNYSDVKMQFV
jgi:AraC-like DNA-binding protein